MIFLNCLKLCITISKYHSWYLCQISLQIMLLPILLLRLLRPPLLLLLRQNFVKFKISNHKLMIEHGRYQIDHLPRENRLCPLCNSNQVEDEIHFLFQCNKYSVQRQAFINQINRIIPDFDKKSSPESIKLIMNSKEHHVNKLVMKFVSSCMKIRDSLFVM